MIARTAFALEVLALALWVGGLASFAFVFAPIAFHAIADTRLFGGLTAHVLSVLGEVGYVCGALSLAMEALRGDGPLLRRRGALIRMGLVAVMLGGTLVESLLVIPEMIATAPYAVLAHDDPRWAQFDAQHHRSSLIYGVVLLCGLATIASAAFGAHRGLSAASRSRTPAAGR